MMMMELFQKCWISTGQFSLVRIFRGRSPEFLQDRVEILLSKSQRLKVRSPSEHTWCHLLAIVGLWGLIGL